MDGIILRQWELPASKLSALDDALREFVISREGVEIIQERGIVFISYIRPENHSDIVGIFIKKAGGKQTYGAYFGSNIVHPFVYPQGA